MTSAGTKSISQGEGYVHLIVLFLIPSQQIYIWFTGQPLLSSGREISRRRTRGRREGRAAVAPSRRPVLATVLVLNKLKRIRTTALIFHKVNFILFWDYASQFFNTKISFFVWNYSNCGWCSLLRSSPGKIESWQTYSSQMSLIRDSQILETMRLTDR